MCCVVEKGICEAVTIYNYNIILKKRKKEKYKLFLYHFDYLKLKSR